MSSSSPYTVSRSIPDLMTSARRGGSVSLVSVPCISCTGAQAHSKADALTGQGAGADALKAAVADALKGPLTGPVARAALHIARQTLLKGQLLELLGSCLVQASSHSSGIEAWIERHRSSSVLVLPYRHTSSMPPLGTSAGIQACALLRTGQRHTSSSVQRHTSAWVQRHTSASV